MTLTLIGLREKTELLKLIDALNVSKNYKKTSRRNLRLMMMSPLYPCGKPCSKETHNETVKKLTLLSAVINRIMMESRPQISNPVGMLSVLQSNQNSITFAVTMLIHKSHNLIGPLESSEVGPK